MLLCEVHSKELVDGQCGTCYDNVHDRFYGEDFIWTITNLKFLE